MKIIYSIELKVIISFNINETTREDFKDIIEQEINIFVSQLDRKYHGFPTILRCDIDNIK